MLSSGRKGNGHLIALPGGFFPGPQRIAQTASTHCADGVPRRVGAIDVRGEAELWPPNDDGGESARRCPRSLRSRRSRSAKTHLPRLGRASKVTPGALASTSRSAWYEPAAAPAGQPRFDPRTARRGTVRGSKSPRSCDGPMLRSGTPSRPPLLRSHRRRAPARAASASRRARRGPRQLRSHVRPAVFLMDDPPRDGARTGRDRRATTFQSVEPRPHTNSKPLLFGLFRVAP
jgi:hypothetical protein